MLIDINKLLQKLLQKLKTLTGPVVAIILFIVGIMISIILVLIGVANTNDIIVPAPKEESTSQLSAAKGNSVALSLVTKTATAPNGTKLNLEVASTSAAREKGLMNRQSLAENSGMLFVFPDSAERRFWMKDTYISLDIIFLDANKKVLNVAKATKPIQTEEQYSSNGNSMYAIEIAAHTADNLGIVQGSTISW